ncbi:hypothetical protein HY641_03630 [Candidatus Woesearchaeota archaeon]|nr:hypothetical protein [Candidatus Woesearchaeota archaeon]
MKISATSIMISRRKTSDAAELPYVVDVKLFEVNDPQKSTALPFQSHEWNGIEEVVITGTALSYCIRGNDIVINDAGTLDVSKRGVLLVIKK